MGRSRYTITDPQQAHFITLTVSFVPTLLRGNAYGAKKWVEVAIQSPTLSKHTLLH